MPVSGPASIRYTYAESAHGRMLVGAGETGICFASFGDSDAQMLERLRARFPKATLKAVTPAQLPEAAMVADLAGDPSAPVPALELYGTDFQRSVWEALLGLPAGVTVTYGELATRIGRPSAVRAAASACGANPVALAVPCHRVVGSDGSMTGYRWGVERKRALLKQEHG